MGQPTSLPQKKGATERSPIYKIAVDNLKHTNFFRALTTSAGVPSSFTATTETTSTLPPPPPPPQQSTVHRDIWYMFPSSRQSQRDLPKDNPLVSVEVLSDDEAPAPKPGKGAKPKTPRKPKPQSTSSQPPKPKPTPAKPQEKKRKLVMETH
ncbi:hypothetical protein Tco_1217409 [Tanacetum coccineum]